MATRSQPSIACQRIEWAGVVWSTTNPAWDNAGHVVICTRNNRRLTEEKKKEAENENTRRYQETGFSDQLRGLWNWFGRFIIIVQLVSGCS